MVKREFTVIVEKDEDGYFVGSVLQLRGCHIQVRSLDELMERIREAILVCLETEANVGENELQFVGIQKIAV